MKIRLVEIAHARSGDKADCVDFGLFAWNLPGYEVIAREVTAPRVQAHFAPWIAGEVQCWPLPRLLALKLVLHDALQGGGARNLRLDNLGKAMAAALLRMPIDIDEAELARCRAEPRIGWWPVLSGVEGPDLSTAEGSVPSRVERPDEAGSPR
ncbi:MAG TPA: hypothetical protein VFZ93_07205 [Albitalea sp.]